jgi:hypothetical protein
MAVGICVDRHRFYLGFLAGAYDADGDFPSVRNEYLSDQGSPAVTLLPPRVSDPGTQGREDSSIIHPKSLFFYAKPVRLSTLASAPGSS